MARMTRRTAITVAGAGGGLLGLGYLLRGILGSPPVDGGQVGSAGSTSSGMMGSSSGLGMMGSATQADMASYMDMFNRHTEIRRTVEEIPGGVRTTTESDSPDLATQLQAHVSSMYAHLDQRAEVRCMSASLPTLFRQAGDYHRQLSFTPRGIVAVETSDDPDIARLIRQHAGEVTGFVREGMPAMMHSMMGPGS
ncbi:MAG: hypothetical protein M3Z25_02185 [Actinomycetota bacterium]|nr:hypothetical protein [Actinomycetota bacterium]